jgi:hypothetical protein
MFRANLLGVESKPSGCGPRRVDFTWKLLAMKTAHVWVRVRNLSTVVQLDIVTKPLLTYPW